MKSIVGYVMFTKVKADFCFVLYTNYYSSACVSTLGGHFPSLISFSFCFWIFPILVYYKKKEIVL